MKDEKINMGILCAYLAFKLFECKLDITIASLLEKK